MIWRKKYLWFIGFFAGLVSYGGEVNFLFRSGNAVSSVQTQLADLRAAVQSGTFDQNIQNIQRSFTDYPGSMAVYILVNLVILGLFVWLIIVSQSAMIRIVGRTIEKKNNSLLDGITVGARKFKPMLMLNIISLLFLLALLILIAGVPTIIYLFYGQAMWSKAAGIADYIVTVPINIVILFLMQYAAAYVVLQDVPVMTAIRKSWNLFRRNWLVSLELAILIFLVNLAITFLVVSVTTFALNVNIYTPVGFAELILILAVVLGVITAFSYTAWTLMFYKLLAGDPESKIGQWTTRLVNFAGPKKVIS